MEKLALNAILFDFYGELLTAKQQEMWNLFYNEDLSLSEIAEELSVSRQAVHDSLKRATDIMQDYDKKLNLLKLEADKEQMKSQLKQAVENENWQLVKDALMSLN